MENKAEWHGVAPSAEEVEKLWQNWLPANFLIDADSHDPSVAD